MCCFDLNNTKHHFHAPQQTWYKIKPQVIQVQISQSNRLKYSAWLCSKPGQVEGRVNTSSIRLLPSETKASRQLQPQHSLGISSMILSVSLNAAVVPEVLWLSPFDVLKSENVRPNSAQTFYRLTTLAESVRSICLHAQFAHYTQVLSIRPQSKEACKTCIWILFAEYTRHCIIFCSSMKERPPGEKMHAKVTQWIVYARVNRFTIT